MADWMAQSSLWYGLASVVNQKRKDYGGIPVLQLARSRRNKQKIQDMNQERWFKTNLKQSRLG